jgi:hypothetical protein
VSNQESPSQSNSPSLQLGKPLDPASISSYREQNSSSFLHKNQSEAHYTRYQSQVRGGGGPPANQSGTGAVAATKLRPFYKWSDGFFDNYLKYCGPESINRRAKKVKMTYKVEEE